MTRFYIASNEPRAGKTLLAVGLALHAKAQGLQATYFKPLQIVNNDRTANQPDSDSTLAATALGLSNLAAPAPTTEDELTRAPSLALEAMSRLRETPNGITLVEGLSSNDPQASTWEADAASAAAIDAPVLAIMWYRDGLRTSEIAEFVRPFGPNLAAVVVNGVPNLRMHAVTEEFAPSIRASGIPIVAILAQRRALAAPTFGELVSFLDGKTIAFPELGDVLAERIMVGALALDGGIHYYGQAERKVVITRWDRPDLQMPALNTGCQGLILTGGQGPIPYVWNRVLELRVPVAVVQGGTVATATRLSEGFLAQRRKPLLIQIHQMAQIISGERDLSALVSPVPVRS
ncbi:MAG: AAA family ATPase [Chloroflexi bacterium]|nr:AAA family ATPase [Chloroflexota bacterium]